MRERVCVRMRARACVLSKSVCVCLGRLGVNMSLQVCCVSAHLPHDTSPQLMHTWFPPPCPPPHPLPIRSTPETNQLGDPHTERPIVADAYQLCLPGPLHQRSPAFPSPSKLQEVCSSKATMGSCGWAISGLETHLSFQPPVLHWCCTGTLFQSNRETEARHSKTWV